MFQCDGACSCSGVDAVGGDGQLRGVVEQVVEQDLAGQHRQERQKHGRRGRGEHVAEVVRGAHQHVLDGVGEDAPALGDVWPARRDSSPAAPMSGASLATSVAVSHRDADVGGVQRQRVVDAVARNPIDRPVCPQDPDQAGLLLR